MASVDDTKEGKIELFATGKKLLTKEGKRKFNIFYVLLFAFVSIYAGLWFFDINYIFLNIFLAVVFLLSNAYVFFTNGYSIKKKKFKKSRKILTKQGVRVVIELLILLSILLALYLAYRLFGVSCSVVLPLAIIVAIVVYFSIGSRWNRLKRKTTKMYKKLQNYFKKFKS